MLQAEEGVEVEVGEGAAEGCSKKQAGGRQAGRQLGNYSKPQARDMSDSYQRQQLRAVTA